MKATDFIRTQKHLNYFNNVRKMDECFGIHHTSMFFEPFELSEGREAYLERVQRIQARQDEFHALRLSLNEKMRKHAEVKQYEGFKDFGYQMGGTVKAVCQVKMYGQTMNIVVTTVDTTHYYTGANARRYNNNITHGFIQVNFTYENGKMRYKSTDKKIK